MAVEVQDGAQFARLVLGAFEAMVGTVLSELRAAGHEGLTVANEFAMQAIDGGAGTAAALARAVGVTPQAAAKTIVALEALGYVERGSDAADGRRKQLSLTDRGREAIAIGAAAFDGIYRRWRAAEGAADADRVVQGLTRLVDPVD